MSPVTIYKSSGTQSEFKVINFLCQLCMWIIYLFTGMFTYNKQAGVYWFLSVPREDYGEFNLVGVVSLLHLICWVVDEWWWTVVKYWASGFFVSAQVSIN